MITSIKINLKEKMDDKQILEKFKKWLDEKGISPLAFSRTCKVNHITIYKAYHGKPLTRRDSAKKIVRYCNGSITLKDLGID